MRNVKNTMVDTVLSMVAPHLCSGCGKIGVTLCESCKYDIKRQRFLRCLVCAGPSKDGICQHHETGYDKAWIVGERQGTLQRLIGSFKFQNVKAASRSLAVLLDERIPALPEGTVIVPVPTASLHIRERGYDHTLLIAQHFAYLRGLRLDNRIISRKHTKTQHGANREDRIAQALSAFSVNGKADPDRSYLVIDDVVTTGSTLASVCRLLRRAGAQTVWVGVLARQALSERET